MPFVLNGWFLCGAIPLLSSPMLFALPLYYGTVRFRDFPDAVVIPAVAFGIARWDEL
jgi:hypothetical protein